MTPRTRALRRNVLLAVVSALGAAPLAVGASGQEILIRDARIVDGTGAPATEGSVRIRGGRIAAIGALSALPGEQVLDADGKVLAPGFIDTHSHHDRGLLEEPGALAAVSQGITTIVVGQDGGSRLPLDDFFAELRATGTAVNVASYVGHGSLRRSVMGDDFRRQATADEIDAMRARLRRELAAGALGLSTGLEYDPGLFASTEEVVALAREAALVGGRYMSHMRSEDRRLREAVDETLRIGRDAGVPVHVSHLKLAMRSLWGEADAILLRLDDARADGVEVTADVYPYTFWQSTMTVLFPERDFEDRSAFEFALAELVAPEGMLIGRYGPRPEYEGRTLAEVASLRAEDPVDTYMALVREAVESDAPESIVATSMSEDDVVRLLSWEHANVASDGGLQGAHPRGFGAFTRVVGPWVREGRLTLEEAVRKSTSLAARNAGIEGRGTLEVGAPADLVLFDAGTVGDRATRERPHRVSDGIERVWVNGVVVYEGGDVEEDGGTTTGTRPGRVLTRSASTELPDSVVGAIDAVFADFDDVRSPGCAVGVVRGDELVFGRGYGMADLEHGVPLGPGSVFRIGSVSKQFTAGAIALLVLDGALALDDPVTKWVPELPDYGPDFTVRRLLHHTSGVRDYLTLARLAGLRDDDWYDDDDLLDMLVRQRETNYRPGSEYLYSNSGYWLLSEIVERVTGSTLAEFADRRIFDPLGMQATHFHDDATLIVPDRAVGYAPTGDGYRISTTTLPMIGDGGVFTSVEELALWARNLADPGVGGAEWMALMTTRGVLTDGDTIDYALGLRHGEHRGVRTLGHGGSFVGYRADLTSFPDHALTVLTLCNRSDASPSAYSRRVAEAILEPYMDAPPRGAADTSGEREEDAEPADLERAQLERWVGVFRSEELAADYRIGLDDRGLRLEVGNGLDGVLRPLAPDVLERRGVRFRAVESSDGRVDAFVVEAGRVTNLRFERVGGG